MPPKQKYTREAIALAAYGMVRKNGLEALTARSLAAELGISTAPLFTAFGSIDEIRECVVDLAKAEYRGYVSEGLKSDTPFKGAGLKYVEFAKNEPMLFKMLFMEGDRFEGEMGYYPGKDESSERVLSAVEDRYGLGRAPSKALYNHLSVYTHGLAVMFAQGNSVFTMDEVSRMLTEIFEALMAREGIEK